MSRNNVVTMEAMKPPPLIRAIEKFSGGYTMLYNSNTSVVRSQKQTDMSWTKLSKNATNEKCHERLKSEIPQTCGDSRLSRKREADFNMDNVHVAQNIDLISQTKVCSDRLLMCKNDLTSDRIYNIGNGDYYNNEDDDEDDTDADDDGDHDNNDEDDGDNEDNYDNDSKREGVGDGHKCTNIDDCTTPIVNSPKNGIKKLKLSAPTISKSTPQNKISKRTTEQHISKINSTATIYSASNTDNDASANRKKTNAKSTSKSNNDPKTPYLPPCKICGAKASGFHYGVNSCEACKGFFRRVLKRPVRFFCSKDNSCNLKRNKRSSCRFCRYKRCLSLGMSKNAIKTGRYSHKKRTQDIIMVKYLQSYNDLDCDSYQLDEILEKLRVSHRAQIFSSTKFQDSFLYKKQKDYHQMFQLRKKSTPDKSSNNSHVYRNDPNSLKISINKHNHPVTGNRMESISDLSKNNSIPHRCSNNMGDILLKIDNEEFVCGDSSQLSPGKSVSLSTSASYDSGFSDYSGNSDEDCRSQYSANQEDIGIESPTSDTAEISDYSSRLTFSEPLSSIFSSLNAQYDPITAQTSLVNMLEESDSEISQGNFEEYQQLTRHVQTFSDKDSRKINGNSLHGAGVQNAARGTRNSRNKDCCVESVDVSVVNYSHQTHNNINDFKLLHKSAQSIHESMSDSIGLTSHEGATDERSRARQQNKLGFKLKLSHPEKYGDAQKEKDGDHLDRAARCVEGYINFAKSIPDFESLSQQDQATLLRLAWDEIWILGAYRGFNCELGVAVMPSGVCFHMEEMEQSWGQDYTKLAFDLADILKKSGITEEMLVLLKAISILSPDRCELQDRKKCEKTHWLLIRCLTNHLESTLPKPGSTTFPGLVAILTSLRNLSELAQAHLSKGILDLEVDRLGRNILSEPVTPF